LSKFVKVEEILGRLEVRELLGVTETYMDYLAYKDPNFPKPFLILKGARLWEKAVILAWQAKTNRPAPELIVAAPERAQVKAKMPVVKPVAMSQDERGAVLDRLFGRGTDHE
jgi:predicted DNA-binding transcriptional regulator AlpA